MELSNQDILTFIEAMKSVSGYDFSEYTEKSFYRRIEKILVDNHMDINQLILKIKNHPEYLEQIVKDITVNTTELFRDPETWQILKYQVLPKFQDLPVINIWHAGCSTGQEVYSMLILLNEMNLFDRAHLIATDINSDVLDVADKGIYKYRAISEYIDNYNKVIKENPYNYDEFNDIPYTKYFTVEKVDYTIRVKPFLRKKTIFLKHDLVKDRNIFDRHFDIIMCRNVLIYFNHNLQNRLFEFFYENLNQNGCLVIGKHEGMLSPIANKFKKKGVVFIKKE